MPLFLIDLIAKFKDEDINFWSRQRAGKHYCPDKWRWKAISILYRRQVAESHPFKFKYSDALDEQVHFLRCWKSGQLLTLLLLFVLGLRYFFYVNTSPPALVLSKHTPSYLIKIFIFYNLLGKTYERLWSEYHCLLWESSPGKSPSCHCCVPV